MITFDPTKIFQRVGVFLRSCVGTFFRLCFEFMENVMLAEREYHPCADQHPTKRGLSRAGPPRMLDSASSTLANDVKFLGTNVRPLKIHRMHVRGRLRVFKIFSKVRIRIECLGYQRVPNKSISGRLSRCFGCPGWFGCSGCFGCSGRSGLGFGCGVFGEVFLGGVVLLGGVQGCVLWSVFCGMLCFCGVVFVGVFLCFFLWVVLFCGVFGSVFLVVLFGEVFLGGTLWQVLFGVCFFGVCFLVCVFGIVTARSCAHLRSHSGPGSEQFSMVHHRARVPSATHAFPDTRVGEVTASVAFDRGQMRVRRLELHFRKTPSRLSTFWAVEKACERTLARVCREVATVTRNR